ncbi:MAG: SDR family NAD(P)-dependent oxidoreductase, partial [Actinobacteria bacterium]
MQPRTLPARGANLRRTRSSRKHGRSSKRRELSHTFGAAKLYWPRQVNLRRIVAALEGKTAIVTGASSGIGAATAVALAREGARVAGGARRIEQLKTEITLELDVTDAESCERFVDTAIDELGGLDILVNNAGLGLGRDPFWESSEQDEETVLETDVHGLIRMTRLCLPHIRDGGHIVNMGSIA